MLLKLSGNNVKFDWGNIPHRKNEVWFLSGNYKKIHELTGWKPKHSMIEGLRKTINWFNISKK